MGTLNLQQIVDDAQRAGATNPEDRVGSIKAALSAEGVGRDDVEALLTEAATKFEALNATDPTDNDSVEALEILAEIAKTARETTQSIDQRSDEVRARREELAAQVLGGDTPGDVDAEKETEEPGDDAGQDVVAEAEQVAADAAAPVTAAAAPKRFDLSKIQPKPEQAPAPAEKPSGLTITASAGVRGVESGSDLDMDGLVAATTARIQAMPYGSRGAVVKDSVAQIRVDFPEELVAAGGLSDQEALERAADASRLDEPITASGGWCAPSETLYELAPLLADPGAGLIDVPEIQVKRGGIRTTEGPSYASIWGGNAGLVRTEAQESLPPNDYVDKVLYRPTCPDFTETRADVVYSGIVVGFLQNDAYPETVRHAISGVTAVHAHRINKLTIDRLVAASTAVNLSAVVGPSATGSLLNGLGLQIVDYRYRYRAPESLIVEVVLPIWTKETVRADYSLREGIPLENVTDQVIASWFATRGARVQWVYDWQDAYATGSTGFGHATPITAYPATVNALVYASGTFVRGRGSVVNLDTVYDSTMTKENDFLQMFMEEKLLVRKMAYQSLNVTLPLGVSGATGTGHTLDNNGKIVPPPTVVIEGP